jgi:hypothetical protein
MRAKYLLAIPALLLGLTIGFRECSEHKRYVSKYEQNFSEYKESARSRQKFVSENGYKENHIKIVNSERNETKENENQKKLIELYPENFVENFLLPESDLNQIALKAIDMIKSGNYTQAIDYLTKNNLYITALFYSKNFEPSKIKEVVQNCYDFYINKMAERSEPNDLFEIFIRAYIWCKLARI